MHGTATRMAGHAAVLGTILALILAFGQAMPARADLLEQIKQRGTFVVGTEARFPPFEFVEGGKIVGYSTDMMEHT